MSEKNESKLYTPKDRTFYSPEGHDLVSYSKTGKTYSKLPSPVKDDIVCNNIAYNEFDYTEDIFDDDDM
ncbi:hypothetical protein [Clostridium sp. LIBA-8841]|uniref:hypothetical protein n=1 Tax=Clostridium sp. LIBA-8841 TaxID=2987530 RepID=UPI002AC62BD9|nr:hypothetical protein [Clostridium sp. LIBA-8841]MDZ5254241.1 hypothetical protein [Clostridium sp. LIBA-8841]